MRIVVMHLRHPNLPRIGFFAALCLIVLAGCLNCSSVSAQTVAPKLTAEQWQADLDFLVEHMVAQHPNLFRRIKKEDFDVAVRQFREQLPKLNEDQIIVGFMKIVAMVRDGHTYFYPDAYFRSGIFPLQFYLFSDGLYIRKADPAYADLVGAKVLRVGKFTAGDALKLTGQVSYTDNEMGVMDFAPMMLSLPEVMAGLGINDDKQSLSVVVERNGQPKTVQVKSSSGGSFHKFFNPPANWVDAGAAEKPLYLKHPEKTYWFEYLPEEKLVYVQQNAVQDDPDETLAVFYRRVMETVGANAVDKLVIDIRNNGGGNNFLNRATVIGLIKSKIDVRGHLFVITGRKTFSAAQNFVNELENYTQSIFVGERTAEHPNLYGDNRPFNLPNSKLEVRVSTLYWQNVDPRDARNWTAPEIAVELSSADYAAGRDPVMQAILNYAPGSSFQELLNTAMAQPGLAGFAEKYRAFIGDPHHRYVQTETLMNQTGYTLLAQKRAADAVTIFRLNAEANPNSANAFDSLGDGYQAAGDRDNAIKSYERALAIDPNFASSRASLSKLKPPQ